MDDRLKNALSNSSRAEIVTTGRMTGREHRTTVDLHCLSGEVYIFSYPGRRDWVANLVATPEFICHLTQGAELDLTGHAAPIMNFGQKRELFANILADEHLLDQLDVWTYRSHLFRVVLQKANKD